MNLFPSRGLPVTVSRSDAAVVRFGRTLLSPAVALPALAAYLLVLFAIRGLLFPGGSNDDSEQLLYSQSFELGYGLRNPPLYTWLVLASEALFGVTLAAVVAVKFLLLAGTYGVLFASARRMAADARWAVAAAASPLAIYYIAWDAIQNYSHTVLLLFICAAAHHCLLRIAERRDVLWYGLFGLALGVGFVTKYNFGLFAVALLGAALTEAAYRRSLADRRIALTIVLAVLPVLPYAAYAIGHAGGPKTGIPPGSLPNAALPLGFAVLAGLERFASFAIGFFSPLVFLLALFFPTACRRLPGGPSAAIRMTGRACLIQAGLFLLLFILAYAFGVGVAVLHPHLFFSFILAPLWFLTRASFAQVPATALPRFAVVLAVLAMIVPLVTLAKFATDPLTARRPIYNVPYSDLAHALRDAGFTKGTVFAWDYPLPLSGFMRVYLPGARVISGKFPFYRPPQHATPSQCLVIWESENNASLDSQVAAAFAATFGPGVALEAESQRLILPLENGWGRTATFRYRLFPDGAGDCH